MPNTTGTPTTPEQESNQSTSDTGEKGAEKQELDPHEFAAQHSAAAVKNQDAPGPKTLPGPAEATDNRAPLQAKDLDEKIARNRQELAALESERARTVIQEYPKMLYHTKHADKDDPMQPVVVKSKDEEDEARGHGWTHAGPGDALKASKTQRGETPNATQYTREDENQALDLPAQMAADQAARTGKPPIDLVLDSDAPDPGAPRSQAGQTGAVTTAAATREAARDVKNAAKQDTPSKDRK